MKKLLLLTILLTLSCYRNSNDRSIVSTVVELRIYFLENIESSIRDHIEEYKEDYYFCEKLNEYIEHVNELECAINELDDAISYSSSTLISIRIIDNIIVHWYYVFPQNSLSDNLIEYLHSRRDYSNRDTYSCVDLFFPYLNC